MSTGYTREEILELFKPTEIASGAFTDKEFVNLNCIQKYDEPEAITQDTLDWKAIFKAIREYEKYKKEMKFKQFQKQREWRQKKEEEEDNKLIEDEDEGFQITKKVKKQNYRKVKAV